MKFSLFIILICSLVFVNCKPTVTETIDPKITLINKVTDSVVWLEFEPDIVEIEKFLERIKEPENIYGLPDIEKLRQEYLEEILKAMSQPIGSGFIVSKYGHLITCAHVTDYVKEAPGKLYAVFKNKKRYEIEKIIEDLDNDVFIGKLITNKDDFISLSIESSIPKRGIEAIAFGTSWPVVFGFTETKVVWGQTDVDFPTKKERKTVVVTTQNLANGFSGGPLVNMKGHVIGINQAFHHYGSFSFYVPISTVMVLTSKITKNP